MNHQINTETSAIRSQNLETTDSATNSGFENEARQKLLHNRMEEAPHPADDAKWYAIYTRSRFEKKIYCALQKAGFQAFLPMSKEKRAWSDRIKTVEVPLLPSYVFIKANKAKLPEAYYLPGFVRYVSFEGKPCEIKEKEICLLERIVTHGFPVQQTTSCCKVGDSVRIVRGPLKGWEGKVESKKGQSRIVFHFDCIQQAISVEVCLSDVERV